MAVLFGMIGVTFFGQLFTPVFYVVIRGPTRGREATAGAKAELPPAGCVSVAAVSFSC